MDRESLVAGLQAAGYERVEAVVEVGQWSLRGGIIDTTGLRRRGRCARLTSATQRESLRLFDPTTQRSVEDLVELDVLPAGRPRRGDGRGAGGPSRRHRLHAG